MNTRRYASIGLLVLLMTFVFGKWQFPARAQLPATWQVTVTLHEALSKTNADGGGDDDIYWKVFIRPTVGTGEPVTCDSLPEHRDGEPRISPEWVCTAQVSGGPDTTVEITVQLWEHDGTLFTGSDDHFDIHPDETRQDIIMGFNPATQQLSIRDLSGWEAPGRCAFGRITLEGFHGEDQAKVVFSVSGSLPGAPSGDSDGDGLLDAWEICGVDGDGDGIVDVDLPSMGADPYRQDLFVEADWFVEDSGKALVDQDGDGVPETARNHSHAPWLPSLVNAWNEFNVAPVTNPPRPDGTPSSSGIALHVDTGNLYAGYVFDQDGDGVPEIAPNVDADGDGTPESLDLDGDGVPDIGHLSALEGAPTVGGNRVCADLQPAPCNRPGSGGEDPILTRSEATTVKNNNFNSARDPVFRYALFGHQPTSRSSFCDSTSGSAPYGGVDVGVFLAAAGYWLDLDGDGSPDDLDGDGNPDQCGGWTAPPRNGPSGLPVDGSIEEHTGTFLHELGHSIGLGHGGGNAINYKPNYLSVMNYHFQIRGILFDGNSDMMADILAVDFDQDGRNDTRRYMYSNQVLPSLSETALNEPAGIGDGTVLTRYGPAGWPLLWRWANGNQPIDWNRDGDTVDTGVNALASPPNPAGLSADMNNDGVCVTAGSNGTLETTPSGDDVVVGNRIRTGLNRRCDTTANNTGAGDDVQSNPVGWTQPNPLTGFNDYANLQLAPPGISKEDQEELDRNTVWVAPLPDEDFIAARCEVVKSIKFEDYPPGTVITDQYAPLASFLRDTLREPTIAGPGDRGGLPTQSPDQSLVNRLPPGGNPVPLVIRFGKPQRFVGLYLGRVNPGDAEDKAILAAFDADGNPLGEVSRLLPEAGKGITGFLGVGAIDPGRSIARVELRYVDKGGFMLADEPVHIDDLLLCEEATKVPPVTFPPPPAFGEHPVTIRVQAKVVTEGSATDGDPRRGIVVS
ncbi:MAG: hypothetical protein Q9O62_08610 [Ardenticatenia bacterium]|nr:hypothetical protein [Ardenticatenia bacterium]